MDSKPRVPLLPSFPGGQGGLWGWALNPTDEDTRLSDHCHLVPALCFLSSGCPSCPRGAPSTLPASMVAPARLGPVVPTAVARRALLARGESGDCRLGNWIDEHRDPGRMALVPASQHGGCGDPRSPHGGCSARQLTSVPRSFPSGACKSIFRYIDATGISESWVLSLPNYRED